MNSFMIVSSALLLLYDVTSKTSFDNIRVSQPHYKRLILIVCVS